MRNFKVIVNGVSYDVAIEETTATAPAAPVQKAAPAPAPAPKAEAAPAPAAAPADGTQVKAPFPGSVVRIAVKAGDTVKSGDVLCVVEAMKMENDITSPIDGTVASVNVNQGQSVGAEQILLVIA